MALDDLFEAEDEVVETPAEQTPQEQVADEPAATPAAPAEEPAATPEVPVDQETPEQPAQPAPTDDPALRSLLREQARQIKALNDKLEAATKELQGKGIIDEPEIDAAVTQRNEIRAMHLETLAETMRLSPKYEDLDSVVSQSRADDIIDAYADAYAKDKGGNAEDYRQMVAAQIWKMPNPYKFLYEKIKEVHPDFKTQVAPTPPPAQAPKPHVAPPSVSTIPASSPTTASGWTSARIDAMSEEELNTVPADVYKKYLENDLA